MDALRAAYADLKTVKTRSVCQVIFELPIEQMTQVVSLLGAPVPSNEVWVAIARLRPEAVAQQPKAIEGPRPFSQLAAFHCGKPLFRQFLAEKLNRSVQGPDEAASLVREICGVASRKDLDTNSIAARRWRDLKADFDNWMRGEDFGDEAKQREDA